MPARPSDRVADDEMDGLDGERRVCRYRPVRAELGISPGITPGQSDRAGDADKVPIGNYKNQVRSRDFVAYVGLVLISLKYTGIVHELFRKPYKEFELLDLIIEREAASMG
jgi:hypothetical protein